MDCEARRVNIAGREVNLTAKEFDVLELLIFHPNKVYSRENLLNIVWGYEYPGDVRTVDVHIRRLREKIEINPSDPQYVHTNGASDIISSIHNCQVNVSKADQNRVPSLTCIRLEKVH